MIDPMMMRKRAMNMKKKRVAIKVIEDRIKTKKNLIKFTNQEIGELERTAEKMRVQLNA